MFRHWMRHTAFVPKGFLRHYILEMLSEKPMAGSEIMSEIEKRTQGHWKPSPGSIYPLLAWLQEKNLISELPKEEGGVIRYSLTDKGKKFLEEELRIRGEMPKNMRFGAPPFLGGLWFGPHSEKGGELRASFGRLFETFFDFRRSLEGEFSEEALEEMKKILDDASTKIEELNKSLKGEKQNA